MTTPEKQELIRLEEVMRRTALGRSSIYSRVRAKTFPAPMRLSRRYSPWNASSVDAWIKNQIEQAANHE